MLSNENKKQNLKRCELCAMPTLKSPGRYMDTYHADLPDNTSSSDSGFSFVYYLL